LHLSVKINDFAAKLPLKVHSTNTRRIVLRIISIPQCQGHLKMAKNRVYETPQTQAFWIFNQRHSIFCNAYKITAWCTKITTSAIFMQNIHKKRMQTALFCAKYLAEYFDIAIFALLKPT